MRSTDYGSGYLYGNSGKSLGGNAGPNAVRQVTKSGGAVVNFSYDNEGNLLTGDGLTISYTSFKQPSSISRGGNSFSFGYGARLERVKEVRNSLTTYEIDKAYEKSSDGSWKLYLDDVAIISHSSADGHRIAYSHKDRLGSSVTFTDHNGQVTGRRHYDAFGKPRQISGALMEPAHRPKQLNFSNFAGVDNAGITRRGFTDHRHLDEAELIHMNGRGYDYNLGRFLSVDPVIQSPGNSQSLNPYSYIMNNPLAGTDPSGYMGCTASKIDSVCESTSARYGGTSETFRADLTNKVSNTLNTMFIKGNGSQSAGTSQSNVSLQANEIGKQSKATTESNNVGDGGRVNSGNSPQDVSDDVYINTNFKGKIRTDVDIKNKIYKLSIKLSAGTENLDAETMAKYISGISEEFNVEGVHSNGYQIVLKTDVTFNNENPDFYINECPALCATGASIYNAGRSAPGSKLVELRSSVATGETAAHEFGHMIGLYHQDNGTKSLMSYAHLDGHDRSLKSKDLERLFQAYRKEGYE